MCLKWSEIARTLQRIRGIMMYSCWQSMKSARDFKFYIWFVKGSKIYPSERNLAVKKGQFNFYFLCSSAVSILVIMNRPKTRSKFWNFVFCSYVICSVSAVFRASFWLILSLSKPPEKNSKKKFNFDGHHYHESPLYRYCRRT